MSSMFTLEYLITSAGWFLAGVGVERIWKERRVA